MAAIRACLILVAILGFFLLGAPVQGLLARRRPRSANRIPLFFCRTLLRLFRVEVDVRGEPLATGPVLVVANHVSWIDILAFGSILPFCFVAKSEVGRWPILSAFAEVQGTVFLDRRRRRSIPPSNRRMAARMLEGRPVLLFPEGTTVGRHGPGAFLTSHFAAARDVLQADPRRRVVSVQPVAIWYSRDDAAWIGDDDLVSHIWRTLRLPPLRCSVRFGTPLAFDDTSNRKTIAHHARDTILLMMNASPPDLPPDASRMPMAGRARSEKVR